MIYGALIVIRKLHWSQKAKKQISVAAAISWLLPLVTTLAKLSIALGPLLAICRYCSSYGVVEIVQNLHLS